MIETPFRPFRRLLLLPTLVLAFVTVSAAQTAVVETKPEYWKVFTSREGRFSAYFPGYPIVTTETLDSPVGKLVFTSHSLQNRSLFRVSYADYKRKFESDRSTQEFLDKYVKVVDVAKAELMDTKEIMGYAGRSLRDQVPDGASRRTIIFLVDQRLYQVSITSLPANRMSSKDWAGFNSDALQFFYLFDLITTEEVLGEVDRWIKENAGRETLYGACVTSDCSTEEIDEKIHGGRVVDLPKPQYPPGTNAVRASGIVKVQLIIDENGRVIAAQAIDGHPVLFGVSVAAAKVARFTPPKYNGQSAKIIGVLTYKFAAQ